MKRRKKFKENWLIACVSALVLTAVGGVLALLFLPSAPESNEPKNLETPTNFEYTMNLTIKDKKTEHLLSWDIVNKATGYKIEIQREESEIVIEKQVDKYTQEYDITNYVISDENYSVKITAVGDEDYLSSEMTELSLKIETATAGLSFRICQGGYEVSRGDAGRLSRMVIPDTFNGSNVIKL